MPDSSLSGTHSKVTSQGVVNNGYLDKVPETASTATRQYVRESSENDATSLTKIILPKTPISIRSVTKRSTLKSSFPNYSNNNGLTRSVKISEDDPRFGNIQVFNRERFQQMRDFKLNNEMRWNKYYGDYNDRESYIPGINGINLEVPFKNRIESSYYERPSQDMSTFPDVYSQTRLTSDNVVLPFNKPGFMDFTRQPLSVNRNMQQDPLTGSHDNGVDEFEPIQEAKKNIFVSRGWGAGGMPFNVLYMKPASRSAGVGAEQIGTPAPLIGFQPTSQQQKVAVENALSIAPKTGNRRGGRKIRRQYSLIPQLFVSYGWGRLGK
jgi:hypothetical protein